MEGPITLFNIVLFIFIVLAAILLALFFSGQLDQVLSPITGINEQEIKDQMHAMPYEKAPESDSSSNTIRPNAWLFIHA